MINTETNKAMKTAKFTVSYIEELYNAFKGNNWKRATNKQAYDIVNYYFDLYKNSAKEIMINDFGLDKSYKIADMALFYLKYGTEYERH